MTVRGKFCIIETNLNSYGGIKIMACFVVPVAEAVVATVAFKVLQSKAKKEEAIKFSNSKNNFETEERTPFYKKLKWLTNLLWGGSFLLAFEHLWHGEVVPYFPFLSAAANPSDAAQMLHEMATVGVMMAVAVTVIWLFMVAVSYAIERQSLKNAKATKEEV